MRIADVMTRDVRVIQPDRTIRDAARLMDDLNVGVLPVCDGRKLVGMITDRDITVRATAAGLAPGETRVREVMTDEVEWCSEDDDVDEIVETMSRRQIRRLPVVSRDRRLVGIVALGDLATDSEPQAARALHRISTPSEPDRSGTQSQSRADSSRNRGAARLSDEERRELGRRLQEDDRQSGDPVRRGIPSDWRDLPGRAPEDRDDEDEPARRRGSRGAMRFRDEDDVRAAFGSLGRPGEERMRNPPMRGGFGGEGYGHYGEDYRRHGAFPMRRAQGSDLLGWRRRPGDDDTSREDARSRNVETAFSLVNEPRDRRNYGVGPGNTRFGNDATGSAGEVRQGAHGGRGPKGYQRSDERIREDVNERLTEDPVVDASEIDVAVTGREVTLSGTVQSRVERRRAEDLALSVTGVTHVQNDLRVGEHQPGGRSGAEAGEAVSSH
jgi:CBS domain-containing protein/osmotically-inducible protein OsmY